VLSKWLSLPDFQSPPGQCSNLADATPLYASAGTAHPEMEFLDINLTRDSSLLHHAIHSSFSLQILKKIILFFGFKILTKKSAKQEKKQEKMSFCRTEK